MYVYKMAKVLTVYKVFYLFKCGFIGHVFFPSCSWWPRHRDLGFEIPHLFVHRGKYLIALNTIYVYVVCHTFYCVCINCAAYPYTIADTLASNDIIIKKLTWFFFLSWELCFQIACFIGKKKLKISLNL